MNSNKESDKVYNDTEEQNIDSNNNPDISYIIYHFGWDYKRVPT